MFMAAGTERVSSPCGPFTTTMLLSSTATDTPAGTEIGDRPMRDISDHRPGDIR